MITIFTDGASRGNPGPGGWGAVIVVDDVALELGGSEPQTTNNRMELRAIIESLSFLYENFKDTTLHSTLRIYTDSKYVLNGITTWMSGWKASLWQTKAKTPVQNKDLWERLDSLVAPLVIEWNLLPGHAGVVGNERCDEIATAFADGASIELYKGTLKAYPRDILTVDIDASLHRLKKEKKARSSARAYSYLSLVDGVIMRHKDWASCEARVKGKKARFKKALSLEDERDIVTAWGYRWEDIRNEHSDVRRYP